MLQCKQCYVTLQELNLEKDKGDFVISCPACGAKNIVAPILIEQAPIDTFKVVGYRTD